LDKIPEIDDAEDWDKDVVDLDKDRDEEEEEAGSSESEEEEDAMLDANLAPPDPGDALADTFAGRPIKVKANPRCRACGATGHKWPTCKKKDVAFILSNLRIVPKIAVADPALDGPRAPRAPVAAAVAAVRPAPRHVARALAELPGPEVAEATVAAVAAPAAVKVTVAVEERPSVVDDALAVGESAARGRRPAIDRIGSAPVRPAKALRLDAASTREQCPECGAAVERAEGWRLTVRLCKSCDRLVHLACATRGRDFVCSQCK
jgi:hypothetical protein